MFEPFQKFIKKAAKTYGISTELQAAKTCQDFRALIPEFFKSTPNAEEYIRPAYFKNKTLVISTSSPAWAQEVIMRKSKIIEEMNRKAGREIINNLRTQLFFP